MDGGRECITPMSNIPQQRSGRDDGGGEKKKERKNWDQTESEEKYWKIKSWKLEKERAKYDTESQEKHEKQKWWNVSVSSRLWKHKIGTDF